MRKTPIDKLVVLPVNKFIKSSTASGIVLFSSVVIALLLANSPWADAFHHFWEYEFGVKLMHYEFSKNLHHWINDGLMAIFFFVVGLELKREFIDGELSDPKNAILPIGAGLGGMIFPALIYLFFNHDSTASDGWGIPMATDIAFALGILHLLGKKVPLALKVFLTVLAIADDIGAVLVIAFFYTSDISLYSLGMASIFLGIMFIANIVGVRSFLFYAIVGLGGFWLAFSMSGVHATISGVLAAFTIPGNVKIKAGNYVEQMKKLIHQFENAKRRKDSPLISWSQMRSIEKMRFYSKAAMTPLQLLEHYLHPIVAFIIMPIFALANAGLTFTSEIFTHIASPVTMGIFLGLILGKSIGITLVTKLLTTLKITDLPEDVTWTQIVGVSFIAGVGFTMSLFINNLAFATPLFLSEAKIGILMASIVSGLIGYLTIKGTLNRKRLKPH
ncbi:Na+/H+ antiporter NhaA [Luteibaculum oceani]|uniref:Na(+)/H(+) antiporter NhaA n=1 Tax=Luteibaculum oceani TaxID=1294296 RepID=A0A5C6V4F0_9FLAO|nr:Na+/H+ antiporter NhaA [Luteibaculum oceani]TXC78618.1 Na+/H+ antiporter NhaA [Luteibaculum oceani]